MTKMDRTKKGFTLVEILIAASLFVVVMTISTLILFDIIKSEKRSNILNAVYDDAKIVMEQIADMIQNNAIDYEEYYSVNVLQPQNGFIPLDIVYGIYNGVYSSRFYDPGLSYNASGVGSSGSNPINLGVQCADVPTPVSISDCVMLYKLSKDKNTVKNPYEGRSGAQSEDANAFCDQYIDPAMADCDLLKTSEDVPMISGDELYLINAAGNKKTIIVSQNLNDQDYAIGMVELDGIDSDQNGTPDLFTCNEQYTCDSTGGELSLYLIHQLHGKFPSILLDPDNISDLGISVAKRSNKTTAFNFSTNNSFVPITPFRSTVVSLSFIINPIEDPYKAYAEADVQTHPSVTILLTMEPSSAEKANYPGGNPPQAIIQRTVTAGVHGKVESYPPTNDLSWIQYLY